MLRYWRWLLLGAAAYVFFLVLYFPARYAARWLEKRLPAISLEGVSGSVWSGEATEISLRGQPWGALHWHFDWLAPFHGNLGYRLQLQGENLKLAGRADVGFGDRLVLRQLNGQLPVSRLAPWLPLPVPPEGMIGIKIGEARFAQGQLQSAIGALELSNLVLQWPETLSLGGYRLSLDTPTTGTVQGALVDAGNGPLALQGQIRLMGNQYRANGQINTRPGAPPDLAHWLAILGPVNAQGAYPWQFNGSY